MVETTPKNAIEVKNLDFYYGKFQVHPAQNIQPHVQLLPWAACGR